MDKETAHELQREMMECIAAQNLRDKKTLRDEFAISALPVILQVLMDEPLLDDISVPAQVAKKAYELADAMLKARKQ